MRKRDQSLIESECPVIVSPELWEAARRTRARNKAEASRNAQHDYLLRSLIKCKHCGRSYSGAMARKVHVYRCSKSSETSECPAKRLRADFIESLVWNEILQFVRNPQEVMGELQKPPQREATQEREQAHHAEAIEQQLKAKQTERQRVIEQYRKGRITESDLESQLQAIEQETIILQDRLQTMPDRAASYHLREAQLLSVQVLLEQLHRFAESEVDFETKQQIVRNMVPAWLFRSPVDDTLPATSYRRAGIGACPANLVPVVEPPPGIIRAIRSGHIVKVPKPNLKPKNGTHL